MKKTVSVLMVAIAAAFAMTNLVGCPAATPTPTASAAASK